MLDEAVDRGRAAVGDSESSWERIFETEPVRSEATPCPPVPFLALDPGNEPTVSDRGSRLAHRAAAIAVGLAAIAALAVFFATSHRSAESGALPSTLPESAEVTRVTVPDRTHADRYTGAQDTQQQQAGTGKGKKGSKHDSPGHRGGDRPSDRSTSGGGDGGGGVEGGGSDAQEPLATANLPVVGSMTVDEPEVPAVPNVKDVVPDPPNVPEYPLSEPKLP
jgi:hypothetical protein